MKQDSSLVIDEKIRYQNILTDSIVRILSRIKEKDYRVILNDVEKVVTHEDNFNNFFLSIEFHSKKPEFFSPSLDNSIVQNWDKIKDKKFNSLVEQSKNEIDRQIALLYCPDSRRQKNLKSESLSHFKNRLRNKNEDGLLYNVYKLGLKIDSESSLIEIVKNILNKKLLEAYKLIAHFSKLKAKKCLFDLRTHFRQIIRFLFKNLDDSHSSLNNSEISTVKNYLFKKKLYEKGIYPTTY